MADHLYVLYLALELSCTRFILLITQFQPRDFTDGNFLVLKNYIANMNERLYRTNSIFFFIVVPLKTGKNNLSIRQNSRERNRQMIRNLEYIYYKGY